VTGIEIKKRIARKELRHESPAPLQPVGQRPPQRLFDAIEDPSGACSSSSRTQRSARVEEHAATERNYQRIDDELSGEDLRRRFEADAVFRRCGGEIGKDERSERMSRLWDRLGRLLDQSRIVLPRRALTSGDLRRGDRLQIGPAVFRIRGSLLLNSGPLAFSLENLEGPKNGPIRLLEHQGTWTLIRSGGRVEVPVDCVVRYPAGGI
jgi:hypothetical protein